MTGVLGFTPLEVAIAALATGSAVLGLYIGLQAYRGLRRYDSRQMLYLSVGMILLFGVAYAVGFAGTLLVQLRVLSLDLQDWLRLVVRAFQFLGLAAIAYSLSLRE